MVFNELLMQFQSDILNVPVIRPKLRRQLLWVQPTRLGLAVGFWKDYDELRANWGKDKEWTPQNGCKLREKVYTQVGRKRSHAHLIGLNNAS